MIFREKTQIYCNKLLLKLFVNYYYYYFLMILS